LTRELRPARVTVSYFPLHGGTPTDDVFILSSAVSRCFSSVTLSKLGLWSPALNTFEGAQRRLHGREDDFGGEALLAVEDVDVTQMPPLLRSQMRTVSHQLAGALVYNLNIDVSDCIFALGKSADVIGHTLQPLLQPLVEQYGESEMANRYPHDDRPTMSALSPQDLRLQALAAQWSRIETTIENGGSAGEMRGLTKGALILVDRLQDLLTPGLSERAGGSSLGLSTALHSTPPWSLVSRGSTGPAPLWEDVVMSMHTPTFNVSPHTLSARERALLQLLAVPNVGLSECVPFLISFLEDPQPEVPPTDVDNNPGAGRDPCRGPGCVLSTLLLVALTLHLVGIDPAQEGDDDGGAELAGEQLAQSLPLLAGAIVEYVQWRSPASELHVLRAQGILGKHPLVVESILATRGQSVRGDFDERSLMSEGILRLELQQTVEATAGALAEVAYRSSRVVAEVRSPGSGYESFIFAQEALEKLQQAKGEQHSAAAGGMRTVLAVSSRDRQDRERNGVAGMGGAASPVSGLLAMLARELMERKRHHHQQQHGEDDQQMPKSESVIDALEYVESPLDKLKRAGLGLLSQGFGAFGFGGGSAAAVTASPKPGVGGTPHPADRPVVVVFVAGGIAPREVDQVREEIVTSMGSDRGQGGSGPRIVLVSNRSLSSPELAASLFGLGG
jgi:hypothetical protein